MIFSLNFIWLKLNINKFKIAIYLQNMKNNKLCKIVIFASVGLLESCERHYFSKDPYLCKYSKYVYLLWLLLEFCYFASTKRVTNSLKNFTILNLLVFT